MRGASLVFQSIFHFPFGIRHFPGSRLLRVTSWIVRLGEERRMIHETHEEQWQMKNIKMTNGKWSGYD
jgi:hypothetical protein